MRKFPHCRSSADSSYLLLLGKVEIAKMLAEVGKLILRLVAVGRDACCWAPGGGRLECTWKKVAAASLHA